jgi:8-oxo-dGTP pyrophosphatase MutT (NUDIX family)
MKLAVAIVLRDGARTLLIRRGATLARAGWWSPPTGRVAAGETPAEAVRREAREELGLDVRALREVWRSSTDDGRYELHWWLADVVGGALVPDPREVAEARWVDLDAYLALAPRFEAHREFFERVLPSL